MNKGGKTRRMTFFAIPARPGSLGAYVTRSPALPAMYDDGNGGRGLHSSTFQLNLSRFCHKMRSEHPLIPPHTS